MLKYLIISVIIKNFEKKKFFAPKKIKPIRWTFYPFVMNVLHFETILDDKFTCQLAYAYIYNERIAKVFIYFIYFSIATPKYTRYYC